MEKWPNLKWRHLAVILGFMLVENFSVGPALASSVSIDDLFFPTLILGDNANIDPAYEDQNKTHSPCIEIDYPGATKNAGKIEGYSTVIWRYPKDNLGKSKGHDLKGVTRLLFWARSDKTMKNVKFSIGAFKGDSDYIPKNVTLDKEWKRFEIPLLLRNLTDIRAGFACKLTENGAVYLNGISYEI
jgi:hypothetical protein